VWGTEGNDSAAANRFFRQLGKYRSQAIEVISLDMGPGYAKSAREHAPQAIIAIDPFHVIAVRHEALPVRAGCKTLPPGCRGSPVKLRTV
jgi:transposase